MEKQIYNSEQLVQEIINAAATHAGTIPATLIDAIKAPTLKQTLVNLHTQIHHIERLKNESELIQIRTPARVWHDNKSNIESLLLFGLVALKQLNIPHSVCLAICGRFDYYHHAFLLVYGPDGGYYSLDFTLQKPFRESEQISYRKIIKVA